MENVLLFPWVEQVSMRVEKKLAPVIKDNSLYIMYFDINKYIFIKIFG